MWWIFSRLWFVALCFSWSCSIFVACSASSGMCGSKSHWPWNFARNFALPWTSNPHEKENLKNKEQSSTRWGTCETEFRWKIWAVKEAGKDVHKSITLYSTFLCRIYFREWNQRFFAVTSDVIVSTSTELLEEEVCTINLEINYWKMQCCEHLSADQRKRFLW